MEQINLSGGRFNYIRQGEGAAVLLVHGLGSSLEDWQPQVEALSRHFRVYALDLRGHGASEPLRAPVSMGELAAEVWGVAIGMANDRLASEREALEVARQEMEQAQAEAVELADQVAAELDAARAQIEQQTAALKLAEAQAAQLAAAQEAAHTAQAALAEAQKRADGLAALLEQERAATREAQAKAEKALTDAAKMAGKLEALQPAFKADTDAQ